MDILVIRHGQSEADILNVIEGRADFELTDEGKKQAKLMADWVNANYSVNKIFSSPLRRTTQTAEYLSSIISIPIIFDDDLMEWQNGLLAGLPRDEAAKRYPSPLEKYPHTAMYECESMIQFRARAENALSKIINESGSDDVIAVISHGGMINMLFRSFLGLPLKDDIWISSGDTGIHRWKIENGTRRVVFSNYQIHLLP